MIVFLVTIRWDDYDGMARGIKVCKLDHDIMIVQHHSHLPPVISPLLYNCKLMVSEFVSDRCPIRGCQFLGSSHWETRCPGKRPICFRMGSFLHSLSITISHVICCLLVLEWTITGFTATGFLVPGSWETSGFSLAEYRTIIMKQYFSVLCITEKYYFWMSQ